ncbi:unnamed protein product [Calicophoron daubneyi]|uniref:Uncharacterized protein n=1 Tax=Calicophoron daubneyi TaxID=300641 RepID=A0AAV2T409_CALDB
MFWMYSWIALTHFLGGLTMFLFHASTYKMTLGTMSMYCYEDRCWTVKKERNPYAHDYNLLRNLNGYYNEAHYGIAFGLCLFIYGLASGLRLTRAVENLGFILNALLVLGSFLMLPIVSLECIAWIYGHRLEANSSPDCHTIKIRAINDLVIVSTVLVTATFQLVMSWRYVRMRPNAIIEPLIASARMSIKESEKSGFTSHHVA